MLVTETLHVYIPDVLLVTEVRSRSLFSVLLSPRLHLKAEGLGLESAIHSNLDVLFSLICTSSVVTSELLTRMETRGASYT